MVLYVPARCVGRAAGPKPFSRAARLDALLDCRFADALADRYAVVRREPPGGRATAHDAGAADVLAAGGAVAGKRPRPTKRQRRALRGLAQGQRRWCVQTLTGRPVAAETDEVRVMTSTPFPAATPELATADPMAAAFPAELEAAKASGATRAGTEPRRFAAQTVVATIRSAARDKAPGPSRLRTDHLWALTSALRDALVRVVQLLTLADGVDEVPPVARRALVAANLLLVVKPGGVATAGVPGLRPIGMPETIRKLVGKALMREVLPDARRYVMPLQREVGVSGACEDVVHEADARLALKPTCGVLQLDLENAFNEMSIQAALAVAAAAFPELVPYLRCIYLGAPPPVYSWGVDDADGGLPARLLWRVERGTQQGDMLGPLIHALALHPSLEALGARQPRCTVLGLHDDVSVIGPVEELAAVMCSAAELGAKVAAELTPAKCAAWSPTPRAPPTDLADQWRPAGLAYFEIPVWGAEFVAAEVGQMAAAHARVVRAVGSLPPDAVQAQLLLLCMCAAPLVTYALRCLPPAAATELAEGVGATIRRALLRLLLADDDRWGTRQALVARAALPVRIWGLGLCDRSVVASAAHVASWFATLRAEDLPAPALRELVRALSALPAFTAPGRPAVGAAPPTAAGGGGEAPPAEWEGTLAWPASAGNAAAAAPPAKEPPLAAAPVNAASPASLAAFTAEGGLWGPLLPRLRACLAACVAKATPVTTGAPGGSPFESVAPQSTDLLMSLPPPMETPNISAAGLHRALGGVPESWGSMLAAPTRLAQRQLAQAAHVAAARGMWAPLSLAAGARRADCCGHCSGLWLNRLPLGGPLGGAMKGARMVAAVRL